MEIVILVLVGFGFIVLWALDRVKHEPEYDPTDAWTVSKDDANPPKSDG